MRNPTRIACLLAGAILLLHTSSALSGELAITFDDAPRSGTEVFDGQQRTDALLESLRKAGVAEAMFFVVSSNIKDDNRNRLEKYAQQGHVLASHSHTHISANQSSIADFIADVATANRVLSSLDGYQPYFRFPYLHRGATPEDRQAIKVELAALGQLDGYVTIDNYDWYMDALLQDALREGRSVDYEALERIYVEVLWNCIEFYDQLAIEALGRSPKHVLLLHENDLAAMFVDKLVEHARRQGWQIIPATSAYQDEIAEFDAAAVAGNQGRIAAIAQANGIASTQSRHESESEEFLQELFEREKIFK